MRKLFRGTQAVCYLRQYCHPVAGWSTAALLIVSGPARAGEEKVRGGGGTLTC